LVTEGDIQGDGRGKLDGVYLGSDEMKRRAKLVCLIACILSLGVFASVGEDGVAMVQKTVDTPAGRFGIWKLSAVDQGYTESDYWLLFGKLGKWHLRTTHQGAMPLLPIALGGILIGTLAFTARQRNQLRVINSSGNSLPSS
jgi:hypothetical protein